MSRAFTTRGIVLKRLNYGEADRILTILTADHGKLSVMAKGVRRAKAKLAGSVELFGVSDLSILPGRGEIHTLISARLFKHFGNIIKSTDRTELGYQLIKTIDKTTAEQPEPGYYTLLAKVLEALNDQKLALDFIDFWFKLHLLEITGHSPNLHSDRHGRRLELAKTYDFQVARMHFEPVPTSRGPYRAEHIKVLRLALDAELPRRLARIDQAGKHIRKLQPLVDTMLQTYLPL